jgi:hypothetical protein
MRSLPRRATHQLLLAALAVGTLYAAPAVSQAEPSTKLHVALVPEQLGHGTTIKFSLHVTAPHGAVPPPVTKLALSYPAHFGIVTSGLGLATCTAIILEIIGPIGCPSRSLMGYGTATGDIQVESEVIEESATTAIFMAPFQNGDIALQFFLNAHTPISVERIFPGLLLPAPPPYGGNLTINVPLIGTFVEGPDASLVTLQSTIGPLGITYYDHTHHQFVPYHPNGILLPRNCPKGGFPFKATLTFTEGTTATSRYTVRCPRPPTVRWSGQHRGIATANR